MSNENHGMQLRPRRSVLGDISNRASMSGVGDVGKAATKPTKRLVRNIVFLFLSQLYFSYCFLFSVLLYLIHYSGIV